MNKKILVIIPAYNEESNILKVITQLKEHLPDANLLVVNDGSTDNTLKIAKDSNLAYIINLKQNLGIGGAVQTGFKFALKYNYDIALQFDGDGQHNYMEISKLTSPILGNKADVVIGSRFLDKNGFQSTFTRRIGIKIFEIINSIIIRQKISDNTSGFRAYNRSAIEFLASNYPQDYPEPEAIILLGKRKFKIVEVAVNMHERSGGQSSIAGLQSAYYMIKVILSILITSIRRG